MKKNWFKKIGWIYLPINWPGSIILLFTIVFCAQVFIAVDHNSHSVSDTLYGIFPFWVGAMVIYGWIAGNMS